MNWLVRFIQSVCSVNELLWQYVDVPNCEEVCWFCEMAVPGSLLDLLIGCSGKFVGSVNQLLFQEVCWLCEFAVPGGLLVL